MELLAEPRRRLVLAEADPSRHVLATAEQPIGEQHLGGRPAEAREAAAGDPLSLALGQVTEGDAEVLERDPPAPPAEHEDRLTGQREQVAQACGGRLRNRCSTTSARARHEALYDVAHGPEHRGRAPGAHGRYDGFVRHLALIACLLLLAGTPAGAEEALSPAERKKRIAAAKAKLAEEERAFAKRVNAADRPRLRVAAEGPAQGRHVPDLPQAQPPAEPGAPGAGDLHAREVRRGPKDKVVKKALGGLGLWFQKIENPGWGLKTYSAAVTILMYDALYNPPPKKRKSDERYAAPAKKKCRYPKAVKKEIQKLLDWLVTKQEAGVWRYPGGKDGIEDMSHAQLVLLALQAAGRCGLEVDPEVYRKALAYVLTHQQADGPEERLWMPNPAYEPGIEDRYGPFLPGPKVKARGWGTCRRARRRAA